MIYNEWFTFTAQKRLPFFPSQIYEKYWRIKDFDRIIVCKSLCYVLSGLRYPCYPYKKIPTKLLEYFVGKQSLFISEGR